MTDTRPTSVLTAVLPAGEAPSVTDLRERVLTVADAQMTCAQCGPRGARWSVEVERGDDHYRVWLDATPELSETHVRLGAISEATLEAARASDYSISVECDFGDRPLWEFRRQIGLLAALAPSPVLVWDRNAVAPRPASWLEQVVSTEVPPSPKNLYTLHCVEHEGRAWLHTHGLDRCGTIELEMWDVPSSSTSVMAQLLHAVAAMFVEHGPTMPGEAFSAGRGIELLWLPWQDAIAKHRPRGPGGGSDRDEAHQAVSGVLLAPKGGLFGKRTQLPSCYVAALEGNPMLYVSDMETERMTLLARERFERFSTLLKEHGDHEEWRFLVKLAYEVDGGGSREHLWFDVHDVIGDELDATLLNAPYQVSHLRQGQRSLHARDRLSDWVVMTPDGAVTPDSMQRL